MILIFAVKRTSTTIKKKPNSFLVFYRATILREKLDWDTSQSFTLAAAAAVALASLSLANFIIIHFAVGGGSDNKFDTSPLSLSRTRSVSHFGAFTTSTRDEQFNFHQAPERRD